MIFEHKHGLLILKFPNLTPYREILHGVFTRIGGVSSKPFHSLNLSRDVGDTAENVTKNRNIIYRHTGRQTMVYLHQTHSARVRVLNQTSKKSSVNNKNCPLRGDAVVTDLAGKNLVIRTADCQAVLLFDPCRKVVANIHSGWRGSVSNVIGNTINTMRDVFLSNPQDILAGIGPSLGPCCAEFVNYKTEIPENLWQYKRSENRFDFWKLSQDQLASQGVLRKNVVSSGFCTRCRTDLFFSYRAEKVTGRFAGIIGLRK